MSTPPCCACALSWGGNSEKHIRGGERRLVGRLGLVEERPSIWPCLQALSRGGLHTLAMLSASTTLFPGNGISAWCDLMVVGDPRYLYYDIFTNASFDDGAVAKDHCLEYVRCRGVQCAMKKHRRAIANLYPELLALKEFQG